MTQKMKDIKADMKRLLVLFEAIMEVWPSNQNTMISVMLQNLQFDGSMTQNYNQEVEWERMNNIVKAIKAMQQYYDYYLIAFLVEEIEMSFSAHEMLEFEERKVEEGEELTD